MDVVLCEGAIVFVGAAHDARFGCQKIKLTGGPAKTAPGNEPELPKLGYRLCPSLFSPVVSEPAASE